MPSIAHRPTNLQDWREQQARTAYREDHERTAVPRYPTFYAIFAGEHGTAYRDHQKAVWFLNDKGQRTLLHNDDAAALMLLGRCDLVNAQRCADDTQGLAHIATSRTT